MTISNDHPEVNEYPELNGFQPSEDTRPLRSKRRAMILRVVVLLGLVGLVVPGILTTLQVAGNTAEYTCQVQVARYHPSAVGVDARWEFAGPGGLGWQCYAIDQNGGETFVEPLGLIPSGPKPQSPGVST